MKTIQIKSKNTNTSEGKLRIILFGATLLVAGICTSCDPDDDGITDGNSGATSQSRIPQEFLSIIYEQPILMS